MDTATDADRRAFLTRITDRMASALMRVLVVYCHPNPESLVAAAQERALAGLATAGHDVRCTDLYADGFDPVMTAARAAHAQGAGRRARAAALRRRPRLGRGAGARVPHVVERRSRRCSRAGSTACGWRVSRGSCPRAPTCCDRCSRTSAASSSSPPTARRSTSTRSQGESGKRVAFRSIRAMCSRRTRTTWCALYGLDTRRPRRAHRLARRGRTHPRRSSDGTGQPIPSQLEP